MEARGEGEQGGVEVWRGRDVRCGEARYGGGYHGEKCGEGGGGHLQGALYLLEHQVYHLDLMDPAYKQNVNINNNNNKIKMLLWDIIEGKSSVHTYRGSSSSQGARGPTGTYCSL